ncbi:MAG: FkbM family methyltransferase [Cytophagales bacterium]|nr:FkbM family methyltransferase [Cytophagales bacterium]
MIKKIIKQIINIFDKGGNYKRFTFSQYGEDINIQLLLRDLYRVSKVNYMDIGCCHPYENNNTYLFYKSGSAGVNIDANPRFIQNFNKLRPRDVNINAGVVPPLQSSNLYFFEMSLSDMSTFDQDVVASNEKAGINVVAKYEVPVYTLEQIVQKYFAGKDIHFMSIDVEGVDFGIIESYDFEKNTRPYIICIENVKFGWKKYEEIKNSKLTEMFASKGYYLISKTLMNDIYVDARRPHFF